MRPAVAAEFPLYTERHEALTPFLYPDLKGIITFDAGIVCTRGMAHLIPWQHLDGTPVAPWEIDHAFDVLSSPEALATVKQGGAHFAAMTDIRASRETLLAAFQSTLARFEKTLTCYLHAWEDAPAHAQLAALSHAWAFGPSFPLSWPSWTKCFNAGDWAGCADQDMPSAHEWALQNPSFKARIQEEQAHLRAASTDPDPDSLQLAS